jgi:predicted nucleic acid-binding Zn ribbon protein
MKNCKNCNKQIPNSKKFCDRSCSATYNNKHYPKRTNGRSVPKCLECGETIPKVNGYYKYDRKYCSNSCQGKNKHSETNQRVISENWGDWNKSTIDRNSKSYLIEIHGNKCMKCGWSEINQWTGKVPIELNHKDGNPENHSISNLELLCPNCHSLSEFTKSRGKGRKWRTTIFLK